MADEELQIEEGKKGKGKLIIIIALVVVLLGGGAGAYFFLFAGDSTEEVAEGEAAAPAEEAAAEGGEGGAANMGTALYVGMPRPFVFNVPGSGRDRLVQIKVQLMVRGSENEENAKTHIPLIEGTLLQVFSASNADDLVTEVGKVALRERSLEAVQNVMKDIVGNVVVEQVLFTGFVMQ